MGRQRHSYAEVKAMYEAEGYELLTKEYKNIFQKLWVRCPKGHVIQSTYAGFHAGNRCKDCFDDSRRKSVDELKEYVEGELGCTLLTKTKLKNLKQPIEYICPNGHYVKKSYEALKYGKCVCIECKKEETRKKYGKWYGKNKVEQP